MKSHEELQGAILATPVVLEGVKVLQTAVEGQRVNWSQVVIEVAAMEGFFAIPAALTVGVVYDVAKSLSEERRLVKDIKPIKG